MGRSKLKVYGGERERLAFVISTLFPNHLSFYISEVRISMDSDSCVSMIIDASLSWISFPVSDQCSTAIRQAGLLGASVFQQFGEEMLGT